MTLEIKVYTDGSADNIKKDKGGIGVYFIDEEFKEFNTSDYLNGSIDIDMGEPTNQKAELCACIKAIETVIKLMIDECQLWELTIYTDSMYTINCIESYAPKWIQYGWRRLEGKQYKEVKNLELIKRLYLLSRIYPIKYKHVRSHRKEPVNKDSIEWEHWYGNKMADQLAKDGSNKKESL